MPRTQLSPEPEYALLLDAVAPLEVPRAEPESWDRSRWGRLLDISDWHRLSPVLFTQLSATDAAPAPVLSALERAYLANAARSLFVRQATADVLGALASSSVASMLLKGAALVETVYTDPAQREMLDIDVLVPAQQLELATSTMAGIGYAPSADSGLETAPSTEFAPDSGPARHHEAALVGQQQLLAVELHRHIATEEEGGSFSLDGLWQRSRTLPTSGHRVPSPEDLLIHLCFHFTRNRLGGSANRRNTGGALAQILDIRRVVGGEAIDWSVLTETAREFGLGTRVFLGLFAASELGVPVPQEEIEPIRPRGFDAELGRRLVALRVLRAGDHLPVRSVRWMFAPSREALRRGWNADPNATLSLARSYMRRATAHAPEARSAMRRPWEYMQDRRLNREIESLEERA